MRLGGETFVTLMGSVTLARESCPLKETSFEIISK